MEASTKILSVADCALNGSSIKRKNPNGVETLRPQKKNKVEIFKEASESWALTDLQIDPWKEKLMVASRKTLLIDYCALNRGGTKRKNSKKVERLRPTKKNKVDILQETRAPNDLQIDPLREETMVALIKALSIDGCALKGGGAKRKNRNKVEILRPQKKNKVEILKETLEPWAPTDSQIDPWREKTLMQKVERCINKLESSQFYHNFRDQLRTAPISEHLYRVLGSESKMQMVIYGIGRIELNEGPMTQLSLAILMKRDFKWIGDIEVFDPVLSTIECRILEALGCSVLSFNEYAKRQALKPTMFFMPHCAIDLYNNLLKTNWKPALLSNIVLLGNDFNIYEKLWGFTKNNPEQMRHMGHILTAHQRFSNEFFIRNYYNECCVAFSDLCWHFFGPITETELQYMNEFLMEIVGLD